MVDPSVRSQITGSMPYYPVRTNGDYQVLVKSGFCSSQLVSGLTA